MAKLSNGAVTLSTDDDLDVAWSKTMDYCQKVAKWNLKLNRNITVDQVMNQIVLTAKDPELHDKAKAVFSKALVCLQRFGSIIAQASSVVFGPSTQVMNGISFLITAFQDYDKMFRGFTTMMERIAAFLQQLRMFLEKEGATVLDKRLRPTIYDVLQDFMQILAHSYRLGSSKREKFKAMTKVFFFGDDSGVTDKLASLEEKIARVSSTGIMVILQDVSEAARDLRTLDEKVDKLTVTASRTDVTATRIEGTTSRTDATTTRIEGTATRIEIQLQNDRDQRITKEQSDQNTKRIKDTLKPDEKSPWWESYTAYQNQLLKGTGKWLLEDHQIFERWADPTQTTIDVLSLSGGEGYGKSCLCSAVAQWLLEKYPKGRNDPRISVAYYFFQRDAKEKATVNQAIRDILWQLTQYDTGYASTVANILGAEEDSSKSKTMDLWKKFIDEGGKKMNATFFVVLDGIDEPESESDKPLAAIIQSLLSLETVSGQQLRIRMLVSGRPSGLEVLEQDISETVPEISLGTRSGSDDMPLNQADVSSYISYHLNNMAKFQGKLSDDLSTLRDRIPDELASGVKGDFVTLGYKLDEISKARNARQIEQILQRANETREAAIAREVSSLDSTLSRDEVGEVNEMLNWLLGGMDVGSVGWIDTECLEGLLLLKTETAALDLSNQITNRYSALLSVDKDSFVTLVSDNIKDHLLSSDREHRRTARPNAEVQDAEVEIMKRLVHTFCGDDLYKRFNFEEFFKTIGGELDLHIHVDESTIHPKVVHFCLIALCEKHEEEGVDSLRDYARMWFVDHLKQIDLDSESGIVLKEIGRRLCKLLMEPAFIDSWWDAEYFDELREDWIDDDDQGYVQTLNEWLSNAAVAEGFLDVPSVRDWVSAAVSDEDSDEHVLKHVLRRLAERWFGDDAEPDTFLCIHGLYQRIHGEDVDSEQDPTIDEIQTIVAWARSDLRDIQGDPHWTFRTAVTLKNCSHHQEAVAECEKVLEQQPDHWRAQLCKAEALAYDEQTSQSRDCYQKLDELSAELLESDENFAERYWEDIVPGLASCHYDLDDLDLAANLYKRALDHGLEALEELVADESDDDQYEYWRDLNTSGRPFFGQASLATAKLVNIWHRQKKFAESLELLSSLNRSDTGYEGTRLSAIVSHNAVEPDFQLHLRALGDSSEAFDFLDQAHDSALANTDDSNLNTILALQMSKGWLAWICGHSPNAQDRTFDIWEGKIISADVPDDVDESWSIYQTRSNVARKMPRLLLERAKQFGPSTPSAALYVERLEKATRWDESLLRGPNKSPKLSLARCYHLGNDDSRAREVLADRMKGVFQDWDEDPGSWWQHVLLAHTLTVMDDDVNALAAWKLLAPSLSPPETQDDESDGEQVKDGDKSQEDTSDSDAEEEGEGSENESQAESDAESQATGGAKASQTSDKTSEGEDADDDANEENDEHASTSNEGKSEEEHGDEESAAPNDGTENVAAGLKGWLHSFCDGCGTSWTYVDNIYVCKDCLDVQLEPNCYAKLKEGSLDPTICSKDHDFLYIPPFDEEKWREFVKDDLMAVGDTVMPRKEWLNGIRKQWGVEREVLEEGKLVASSIRAIERFWRIVQRRRAQG